VHSCVQGVQTGVGKDRGNLPKTTKLIELIRKVTTIGGQKERMLNGEVAKSFSFEVTFNESIGEKKMR